VHERLLTGIKNRILQLLVRHMPGERTVRVAMHRWRGVKIGRNCAIGADALLETAYPHLISLGDGVYIGIRTIIIGHFRGQPPPEEVACKETVSVRIEDDAFIGPGVVILPGVTIGRGAVVTAGSVVARSVPAMTMVQGNPAAPVARCGVPLGLLTPLKDFHRGLRPVRNAKS
jgi:acetyltransferase-like isoleucine patch superfamily enzyme